MLQDLLQVALLKKRVIFKLTKFLSVRITITILPITTTPPTAASHFKKYQQLKPCISFLTEQKSCMSGLISYNL